MNYTIDSVSLDPETKQHVLILKQADSGDLLALNVLEKEATVLKSLLAPGGLPGTEVLGHLRDSASRGTGHVVGIQLLLYGERANDVPALTPVLVVKKDGSPLEQAVPAALGHAAAWSLALNLPFEIDDALLEHLHATVTIIPGEVPSGFRAVLEGLEEIDGL